MKKPYFPYLLEFIIFTGCAGLFTSQSIKSQYVYNMVSRLHHYTKNSSLDYCAANTSATGDDIVATEASRWQMYNNIAYGIPAVFVGVLLTSWSDIVGRKIPLAFPVFGFVVSNIIQLLVIIYSWPLYMLIVSSFIYGAFGGFVAMLNIGMAILSDMTTEEQKVTRYTLLECSVGLGGGLISFACGFWITADGFIPSSYLATGFCLMSLLLIPFLPSKNSKNDSQPDITYDISVPNLKPTYSDKSDLHQQINEYTQDVVMKRNDIKRNSQVANVSGAARFKLIKQVYFTEYSVCNICDDGFSNDQKDLCPHGGGLRKGRVWRIWFYLIAFNLYLFPGFGIAVFETMYFVSYPLCFSPTLLGIKTALNFGSIALAPVLILICKRLLKMRNVTIILVGICVLMLIDLCISVARQQYLVLIACCFYVFMQVNSPVLRSQISSLASVSEQGAALSLISGTENVSNMLSNVVYLLLYPATLPIYHGFMWCLSAAILLIPLTLILTIWIADKRKISSTSDNEDDRAQLLDT